MKKLFTVFFVLFVVLTFACASFAATIKKVDEPAVKLQPGEAATKVDKTNKAQQSVKDKKVPPVKPNGAEKAGAAKAGAAK